MIKIALTLELIFSFIPVLILWALMVYYSIIWILDGFRENLAYWPLATVIATGGFTGMYKLAKGVLKEETKGFSTLTILLVLLGIILGLVLAGLSLDDDTPYLILLFSLPVLCALHFLYLAQKIKVQADNNKIN